jgi:hypothetical protein
MSGIKDEDCSSTSRRLTITIQDFFYFLEHYGQRGHASGRLFLQTRTGEEETKLMIHRKRF